jgi:hypothetical protein
MSNSTCTIAIPKTLQELDEAVLHFQTSDLKGEELIRCWQAIREASLEEFIPEGEGDRVPGDQSY